MSLDTDGGTAEVEFFSKSAEETNAGQNNIKTSTIAGMPASGATGELLFVTDSGANGALAIWTGAAWLNMSTGGSAF